MAVLSSRSSHLHARQPTVRRQEVVCVEPRNPLCVLSFHFPPLSHLVLSHALISQCGSYDVWLKVDESLERAQEQNQGESQRHTEYNVKGSVTVARPYILAHKNTEVANILREIFFFYNTYSDVDIDATS